MLFDDENFDTGLFGPSRSLFDAFEDEMMAKFEDAFFPRTSTSLISSSISPWSSNRSFIWTPYEYASQQRCISYEDVRESISSDAHNEGINAAYEDLSRRRENDEVRNFRSERGKRKELNSREAIPHDPRHCKKRNVSKEKIDSPECRSSFTETDESSTPSSDSAKVCTVSESDFQSLYSGECLNDACLNAMLDLVCREHVDAFAVSSYFYPHLISQGWDEARRYFQPPACNDDGLWTSRSGVPIDCKTMVIPIITGTWKFYHGHLDIEGGHWTIVIRKQVSGKDSYRFFFYDTFNDLGRMESIRKDLDDTLLYNSKRDGGADVAWTLVSCAPQTEVECGPRATLAAALALQDKNTMGAAAQAQLLKMCMTAERCRSWIEESLREGQMKPTDWVWTEA